MTERVFLKLTKHLRLVSVGVAILATHSTFAHITQVVPAYVITTWTAAVCKRCDVSDNGGIDVGGAVWCERAGHSVGAD